MALNKRPRTNRLLLLVIVACCGCSSSFQPNQRPVFDEMARVGDRTSSPFLPANQDARFPNQKTARPNSGRPPRSPSPSSPSRSRPVHQATTMPASGQATVIEEVIAMCRAGVSEDVVSAHLISRGIPAKLEVADLICLKQNGVSDDIVRTLSGVNSGPAAHPVTAQGDLPAHGAVAAVYQEPVDKQTESVANRPPVEARIITPIEKSSSSDEPAAAPSSGYPTFPPREFWQQPQSEPAAGWGSSFGA